MRRPVSSGFFADRITESPLAWCAKMLHIVLVEIVSQVVPQFVVRGARLVSQHSVYTFASHRFRTDTQQREKLDVPVCELV